jgi:hypothetical protein
MVSTKMVVTNGGQRRGSTESPGLTNYTREGVSIDIAQNARQRCCRGPNSPVATRGGFRINKPESGTDFCVRDASAGHAYRDAAVSSPAQATGAMAVSENGARVPRHADSILAATSMAFLEHLNRLNCAR